MCHNCVTLKVNTIWCIFIWKQALATFLFLFCLSVFRSSFFVVGGVASSTRSGVVSSKTYLYLFHLCTFSHFTVFPFGCCAFVVHSRQPKEEKNDALDVCILCDEPCFDINQCTKHYIVSAVVYAWEMLIYSFFRFLSLSLSLFFYYSLADKRVSDWTRKCEYDALIYAMDVFQKICFVHNINDTHTHKHTNSNDVQRRHRPPLQKRFVVGGGGVSCFESGGRYYKKKSSHILHHASTNSRFVIKKKNQQTVE